MSRFERKIFFAILLVAVGPLIGSLILASGALRHAYERGINDRYHQALEAGVDAQRDYLMTLRENSERTADAIAASLSGEVTKSPRALRKDMQEQMERYPEVVGVSLRLGENEVAKVASRQQFNEPVRRATRTRTILHQGQRFELDVEMVVPAAHFERLETAGEALEGYSRLREQRFWFSRIYVAVYAGFLLIVIILALVAGVVLSRRVTRRVAILALATRKVGAGDLTVTLPTGASDEVTELTKAFNEMVRDLRESRSRIEYLQRIGAWQEFARRLAHEIKNPLTPIQLAAQEMEHSYDGADPAHKEKLQHARAIIEEEVATLRRLVSEFSSFAKLPEADLEPSDLRDFMQSVEISVPAVLEDVGRGTAAPVEVTISCATEPLPVRMDPMMLKRGVDNLLRNAVQAVYSKYPDGGGKVTLSAFSKNQRAFIEVQDNGPGIPPRDWDRAFDPYFTTKAEGTGLGLAIVKKVILEHNGEVRLARSPNGGALFRIELPLTGRG